MMHGQNHIKFKCVFIAERLPVAATVGAGQTTTRRGLLPLVFDCLLVAMLWIGKKSAAESWVGVCGGRWGDGEFVVAVKWLNQSRQGFMLPARV